MAVHGDASLGEVNFQFAAGEAGLGWGHGGVAAVAEGGLDACHQFGDAEGFGQVVIGAQFQALDLVLFIASGAEHYNGHVGPFPDAAAHLHPVHVGHHNIQDYQVDKVSLHRLQ